MDIRAHMGHKPEILLQLKTSTLTGSKGLLKKKTQGLNSDCKMPSHTTLSKAVRSNWYPSTMEGKVAETGHHPVWSSIVNA